MTKKTDSQIKKGQVRAEAPNGGNELKRPASVPLREPKGMHDILPYEQPYWDRISKVVSNLADFYGFWKIDTPILEFAELFIRGIGEDTNIVEKEMYLLKTKGGDLLALRPEGTAPIARSYLEHNLGRIRQPQKLYYWGPMFRHENPQAGRYRQFYQAGFEIVGGVADPIYDAQVIVVSTRLLDSLKIKNVSLKMNSIGCRICRPIYKRNLKNYYRHYEKELCVDCIRRLKTNPLRLLDCKNKDCEQFKEKAPNFLDKLCATCTRHLQSVLEYLDELKIPYDMDNQLVRGLDYYSRTVFEFFAEGTPGAICSGGRYDYLIEVLGGRMTPAVGAASGIERLIEVMKTQDVKLPVRNLKKVFIIHVGQLAKKKSLTIIEDLRQAGISVSEALSKDSIKVQMRVADKQGARFVLIFGQREIYEESIILRDLKSGLQESVVLAKLASELQKRLREP